MNEGKKDRRDPIRTIKAKNPVAKNANKAIGGGAAGPMKDKKKAEKKGEVKHKKKEVAESYEDRLTRQLNELSIDSLKSYKAKRQVQQDAAKAATPNPRTGDKDWIDQAVRGINMNTAQKKINRKEKDVTEAEGVSDNITDNDMAKAAYQDGVKIGRGSVGNNMDHYKKVWGEHFKYFNQGFLKGRNANAKTLKAFGQGDAKKQGMAEGEGEIPADGTPEYNQFINRGGVNQKSPFDLGGADAYYGRQHDITAEYGFQKGSPEWDEYIQGYRDTYQNKDMRKDYGSSRSSVQPRRITKTPEAMNGITGPGMMRDPAMEDEGDKEGLPHLTKELAQHIADQIDSEGAHAIVKSVEWGDGAADELVQFIKRALQKAAGGMKEDSALTQHRKRSASADTALANREAARKANPGAASGDRIKELEKRYPAKEGWTHDSLADQLFEHERTYEEQLAGKLAKQLKK